MQSTSSLSFDSLIQKGSEFQQEGRWIEAEACYRKALTLSPGHPTAHNFIGVLAFTQEDFIAARLHFEAGLRAASSSELIFTNLARVLYVMGDWESLQHMVDHVARSGLKNEVLIALSDLAFGKKDGRKIFCIGRHKTGTTSLEKALADLGFSMGHQPRGEMLLKDWQERRFDRIAQLTETADAFQDTPFALPETYAAMDALFPNSKFILTIRDTADQWYQSLTRFHAKIVNQGKHIPTAAELKEFPYRYPGHLWDLAQANYGVTEESLYDRSIYIDNYLNHNASVLKYFSDRPKDLLVLNVSESDSMQRLCDFLGVEWTGQTMPHSNKT
ncbi:MAG: sulfotransferase [Pseudomonadota bacterium]|nr:sulfotransferase [Pseudomonadota bacterium]